TALASRTDDTLTRLRRGDLLSRLGDDAQELGDHVITALVPAAVSVVMALVVLATFAPLSPTAAAVMLAALVLTSVLAPLAAHRAARITQQTVLTTRAESARSRSRSSTTPPPCAWRAGSRTRSPGCSSGRRSTTPPSTARRCRPRSPPPPCR